MPHFNYTGTDAKTGAAVEGTIEAPHERYAFDMLRANGVVPTSIKPARTSAPGPSTQPPAPGALLPRAPGTVGGRPSSIWATGIGGGVAGVLGVLAFASMGQGEWLCPAAGVALLGLSFLCLLHVVIVDAGQSKADRYMQAQQYQQLATIIEQNRQIIEAIERREGGR